MMIDWFTVFAQIINFLILVFLLKKFLYKPILDGIDKRKKEIESSIKGAANKEAEAKTILEEYQQKKNNLENKAQKILERANNQAQELLKKKTEQMNKEVAEIKNIRLQKIHREEEEFKEYVTDTFRRIIVDICRKVIQGLSSSEIDEVTFDKFLGYLKEELPVIQDEIKDQKNIRLITAHELTPEHKHQFQEIIQQLLSRPSYHYHVDEDNILGVNLIIDGYELSWNASSSLNTIGKQVTDTMNQAEFLR